MGVQVKKLFVIYAKIVGFSHESILIIDSDYVSYFANGFNI